MANHFLMFIFLGFYISPLSFSAAAPELLQRKKKSWTGFKRFLSTWLTVFLNTQQYHSSVECVYLCTSRWYVWPSTIISVCFIQPRLKRSWQPSVSIISQFPSFSVRLSFNLCSTHHRLSTVYKTLTSVKYWSFFLIFLCSETCHRSTGRVFSHTV